MPTLKDLEDLATAVAPPIIQGITNTRGATAAVNNLTQGATAAQGTITDAQKQAQAALDKIKGQNTDLLSPLQPGGAVSSATSARDASLLQPFQPGGAVSTDTTGKNAALLDPYQRAGTDALKAATGMVTPGSGYDFTKDPSYQWRLQQGEEAIKAGANSGGIRFSGATLKALNDYAGGSASQEFGNAFGRQMGLIGVGEHATDTGISANLTDAQRQQAASEAGVSANLTEAGQQQNAINAEVGSNLQYGNETVGLTTGTSKAIADLQTSKASALAAGDIAKANAIDQTIASISQGLTNAKSLSAFKDLINPGSKAPIGNPAEVVPSASDFSNSLSTSAGTPGAGGGAPIPNAAGANDLVPANDFSNLPGSLGESASLGAPAIGGGAAAAGGLSASLAAGGATDTAAAASMAGASAASPFAGEAAIAGDTAAGGMMSSVGAFMTNPITIGVAAAAIAAYALIKHSQVHQTADKLVQGFQKPFDKQMGALNDHFIQAANSGQLSKSDATQIRNTVKNLSDQYQGVLNTWIAKGGKEGIVAKQAQQTANEQYGQGFSKTLDAMDSRIQGMAA